MEIEFYDFEDELRSIIFAFESKSEQGVVMAICNPRFEYQTTFNVIELHLMHVYFNALEKLKAKGSVTDLKLANKGIFMCNAQLDGDTVIFELIIQQKEKTGFKKTHSKVIYEADMLETLVAMQEKLNDGKR